MEKKTRADTTLVFFLNGKKVEEPHPNPEWTLIFYLRNKLRRFGTKESCGEGGCGACTVLLSRLDPSSNEILHSAINSCTFPLCAVHGTSITTIEGVGSIRNGVHPIQERLVKNHGSQCGFCTPGMVMSMFSLLKTKNEPTIKDIEDSIRGNMCRCTGYRPILDGLSTFSKPEKVHEIPGGPKSARKSENCCADLQPQIECCQTQKCCKSLPLTKEPVNEKSDCAEIIKIETRTTDFEPYDPSSGAQFPEELMTKSDQYLSKLKFKSQATTWYRPVTLESLLALKRKYPEAKFVGGNTTLRQEMKNGAVYPKMIHVTRLIPELAQLHQNSTHLIVGAAVTFTQLQNFCLKKLQAQSGWRSGSLFVAIVKLLDLVADMQVRNVASIGGSIAAGGLVSDSNNFFVAANSSITLMSTKGSSRVVKMNAGFFEEDGETAIKPTELIVQIKIPLVHKDEFMFTGKTSRRKYGDLSTLTCSSRIKLTKDTSTVQKISIIFNGFSIGKIVECPTASSSFVGKPWSAQDFQNLIKACITELPSSPSSSPDPHFSVKYRNFLVQGLMIKFYKAVATWLKSPDSQDEWLALNQPHFKNSTQLYQIKPPAEQPGTFEDLVGRPVVHVPALKQATGEGTYLDDIPPHQNELYGSLVLSQKAHAKILTIDYTQALRLEGLVAVYDASSFGPRGGQNRYHVVPDFDDFVFAEDQVFFYGQPIAMVVATEREIAQKGATLVEIEYEEKSPIILTVQDAIEHKSFTKSLEIKTPETKIDDQGKEQEEEESEDEFSESESERKGDKQVTAGEFKIGGQKHYYMEPSGAIAYPKENGDELEIFAAVQDATFTQNIVAHCLNLKWNQVTVKSKRLGGAFGGKYTRTTFLAVCVALAARDLNRPVRLILQRSEDMLVIGGRSPMTCRYKIFLSPNGSDSKVSVAPKIKEVRAKVYSNGGTTTDGCGEELRRAMQALVSLYKFPKWNVKGYVCKTNMPPTTSMRAVGGSQGSLMAEHLMDLIIAKLKVDPILFRESHLYQNGDMTPNGYTIRQTTISQCWEQVKGLAEFERRRHQVAKFNIENQWRKKGLALNPLTFVMGFSTRTENQGGALVLIYQDGTVQLNHGGCEMGQGLWTKMLQIASKVLQIPMDKIRTPETSTDKIPNSIGTGGSMSTDIYGPAVLNACKTLMERLEPIKKKNPGKKWEDWILTAHEERVNLSATGFNTINNTGKDFGYLSFGAGCAEVEVDCLTGDYKLVRADLCMDVGTSVNPAIDVGQIEGGFVQGLGLVTLEETLYSPVEKSEQNNYPGKPFALGPGTYKIPNVMNISQDFRVSLLRTEGVYPQRAIYSSKGIGEPGVLLGKSVFFAIKDAVRNARKENGMDNWDEFEFNSPATAQSIRLACGQQRSSS